MQLVFKALYLAFVNLHPAIIMTSICQVSECGITRQICEK